MNLKHLSSDSVNSDQNNKKKKKKNIFSTYKTKKQKKKNLDGSSQVCIEEETRMSLKQKTKKRYNSNGMENNYEKMQGN